MQKELQQKNADEFVVILTTAPDAGVASHLARGLVTSGLAGCVTVLPGATSIYRWDGKIEESSECQLVVKTLGSRAAEVMAWLRAAHPYEEPELLALPIASGSESYLTWLKDCAAPEERTES